MKRPAESDMIIYAREAFRAAGFGSCFVTEALGADSVRARSRDWSKRVTVRWDAGSAACCAVALFEDEEEWCGASSNFTLATWCALEARELVPAREARG